MAVRHRERPHWGVQFHPESVETEWGERLLRELLPAARRSRAATQAARRPPRRSPPRSRARAPRGGSSSSCATVRRPPDAETRVRGPLRRGAPNAFWLD